MNIGEYYSPIFYKTTFRLIIFQNINLNKFKMTQGKSQEDFDNYKLVHNFIYPMESLKLWITSDNYTNNYIDDYNSLMKLIDAIEMLICDNENNRPFFDTTNHIIQLGGVLYIDSDISGVYQECVKFIKTLDGISNN